MVELGSGGSAEYREIYFRLTVAAVLLFALAAALGALWTCDDAYISYRYARNLVEGHGLVFNPGERVEGYTNFLWTVWVAAGLATGLSAEAWSHFWSVACYLTALLLLVWFHLRLRRLQPDSFLPVPVAALAAALHPDWSIYASSGLETSLYTFLQLSAFMVVTGRPLSRNRLFAGGLILGAAFLTRPDAVVSTVVTGLFVLWQSRRWFRSGLVYSIGFFAVALPFLLFRALYYGDLFPNTYYAKSAYLTWYTQGWHYVSLYFWRYWPLGIALLVTVLLLRRMAGSPGRDRDLHSTTVLALTLVAANAFYLIRVGGDFMFARMMIPVTPMLVVLLEISLTLLPARRILRLVLTGLLLIALRWTPSPVTGEIWYHGIANEWMFYSPERVDAIEYKADVLRHYFADLPVTLAYLGADARVAYQARLSPVIDCHGLTDRYISRLELSERGRVGHEKLPDLEYLVGTRRAHFIFDGSAVELLGIGKGIPKMEIQLGGIDGYILHWDPPVMDALRRKGVQFEDFPTMLDDYIARLATIPEVGIREDLERFRLFYFDHAGDEARLKAILEHLGTREADQGRQSGRPGPGGTRPGES